MDTQNTKYIRAAFTLVELIITITLIAVLATIGFMKYSDSVTDARDFKRVSDVTSIKVALDSYQKKHGGQFFRPASASTGVVYSGSLANSLAFQMDVDDSMAGILDLPKAPADPSSGIRYVYSVSNHGLYYQVSTTLETAARTSYLPIVDTAYAAACSDRIAYVEGNFVPRDLNTLPGLVYAFDYRTTNLDISNATNRKKVVLDNQSINLAYDADGKAFSCSASGSDVLAVAKPAVNTDLSASALNCSYSTGTIADGDNYIQTLAGTSTGQQIGWQYKTCANGVLLPSSAPTDWYYTCKNIPGAIMSPTCVWNGCKDNYVAYSSGGTTECRFEGSTVPLAYPAQGAFGVQKDVTLAWYPAQWSNADYTVYLSSDTSLEWTAYPVGSNLKYTFTNLESATTYYWKVKTKSALNASKILESEVRSFTVAGSYVSGTWSSTIVYATGTYVAPPWTDPCPSGTVCRADEVYISYVGWNGKNYAKWDFGESRRVDDVLYGDVGTSVYKFENKSDGLAKFKVKFSDTSSGTSDSTWKYLKKGTTFSDTNALDIGWDGVKNLYMDLSTECLDEGTDTISVKARTTCVIKYYYRSDVHVASRLAYNEGSFPKFKWFIENADSLNSNWHANAVYVNGQGDKNTTYTTSGSPVTMVANSYDFQVDLRIAYDSYATWTGAGLVSTGIYTFGQSPRYMDTLYGVENTVRFKLENLSLASAYFKVKTADASSGSTNTTALAYQTESVSMGDANVINIGGDTRETKNFFFEKSTDCVIDAVKGYRIFPGKTCYITFHARSDEQQSVRVAYTWARVPFAKFFVENTEWTTSSWRNPGGVNDQFATAANPAQLHISALDGYLVDLLVSWVTASGATKHDFWSSAKDGANFYGLDKTIQYKFENKRNGIAYFKLKLADAFSGTIYGTGAQTWSGLTYTPALTSYADSQVMDIWGEKILGSERWASNLYWEKSAECQIDPTYGYKIVGNQTCTVTFHGRSDPSLALFTGASVPIAKFVVENTYPTYSKWLNGSGSNDEYTTVANPVVLSMRSSGYTLPNLSFTYVTSAVESGETSTDAGSGTFGTSNRSTTGTTILPTDRAYWKSLVYRIQNTGNVETYFKIELGGGDSTRLARARAIFDPLNQVPNAGTPSSADSIFNQSSPNLLNIWSDGKNNFYYNNGDMGLTNQCPIDVGWRGYKLNGGQSCNVTLFYRGDISIPRLSSNIMQLNFVPMQRLSYNDDWQTPVYKFSGQTGGFAFTTQKYVASEVFGWIWLDLTITGTMIEGYGKSEVIGHVCFDTLCGARISRDAVSGSLQGYAVSEAMWWIKLDNVTLNQSNVTSGYGLSETAGWIKF